MVSLYGRLFAYRERRDRRPLEDFLTEALCDLLNRLPRDVMGKFVAKLFLPPDTTEAWRQVIDNGGKLLWKTQEQIGADGRLDLMLCRDEGPLIVVENKIGAKGTVDQLAGYGQWLGRQVAGQDWRGAVVFLTHFTPPPDGFATGDIKTYGVPWQYVCRWPAVWQWLNANVSSQPATAWQALAKELAEFLGDEGMTSEMMTQHDLAALEVYLPSAARVDQLFKHLFLLRQKQTETQQMRRFPAKTAYASVSQEPRHYWISETCDAVRLWNNAVNPGWPNELWGHDRAHVSRGPIHYFSAAAIIWDWGYLRSPNSPYIDCWHLGWGIGFPDQPGRLGADADPQLPRRSYAFFGLFSEVSRRPLPSDPQHGRWGLGDGWSVSASDNNCLIKARAVCDFDPDPNRCKRRRENPSLKRPGVPVAPE